MFEESRLIDPRDRLIVALDLPSLATADTMVERLGDSVSFYKIGYQLAFAGGLSLAPSLIVSPAPSTARIMTADTTVLPPPQSLTNAPPFDLPLPKPDLGHGSSGAPSTGSR